VAVKVYTQGRWQYRYLVDRIRLPISLYVLPRFFDTARHWSKIAIFFPQLLMFVGPPPFGVARLSVTKNFGVRKLEFLRLPRCTDCMTTDDTFIVSCV